ncbi:hypothetical protein [Roseixanthobacter glucoisosaccharinicivorans]|uniref:hypothetical protein n=1 Tax=Roseixanthobacter glucoisosaccharinicivorans TaxID=3119923 RepID=UPI003728611D
MKILPGGGYAARHIRVFKPRKIAGVARRRSIGGPAAALKLSNMHAREALHD